MLFWHFSLRQSGTYMYGYAPVIKCYFSFYCSLGGKTPDPSQRVYSDIMKEDMLKKQEVRERGERGGGKGGRGG